jgi:hypothetical protein
LIEAKILLEIGNAEQQEEIERRYRNGDSYKAPDDLRAALPHSVN